jgi:DNA-directed RNA polymerase subunit L
MANPIPEERVAFTSLRKLDNQYLFTITPIHVSYVNTLRRIILTGVESVGFRSDMISTGSKAGTTTDVVVHQNDTPMTNEMLADRIGLLPITVQEPLTWKKEKYIFTLDVEGSADKVTYVTASNITIKEIKSSDNNASGAEEKDSGYERIIATDELFPPHPRTGQTSLIAMLQPSATPQKIHITAVASIGTGREHARFSTVSQCSYEYTLDNNPERIEAMFTNWLSVSKKISSIDKATDRYAQLQREFKTMQIKRCYLMNEKQQPYSFDFTVESVGPLSVEYIIKRACEVGENMCMQYINIDKGNLPKEITLSAADSRIVGFDFLVRGHDHTLGNLLQTWLVENHIEGNAEPKIYYAGYSVPHPLRDEMVLRIGAKTEDVARKAFAEAAKGSATMFRELRSAWERALSTPRVKRSTAATSNVVRAANPSSMTVTKLDEQV